MPQLPATTVVTPWLALGGHVAVEERAVVMGVDVDEARRDDEAARVDLPFPGRVAKRTDLCDAPAVHGDVARVRRRTRGRRRSCRRE